MHISVHNVHAQALEIEYVHSLSGEVLQAWLRPGILVIKSNQPSSH